MTPKLFPHGCRSASLFLIGLFAIGSIAPVTGNQQRHRLRPARPSLIQHHDRVAT